jgi:hypothetical protein
LGCSAIIEWYRQTTAFFRTAGMRIALKYLRLTPVLAAGATAVATQPSCVNLSSSSTKCQSPGDAELNDSLPYANVLPQWSFFGGQSGGPYGGTGGGAG